MVPQDLICFLLLMVTLGLFDKCCMAHKDNHGGVQMGIKDINCDDGEHNLNVDWDGYVDDYKCPTARWPPAETDLQWNHEGKCEPLRPPLHKCMTTILHYNEVLPTSGNHRPLWAQFGEYLYLPKQRWLHNLEHGCAVFLYHPCAPENEIQRLRDIATRCLRKHIISPYQLLTRELPFAIVTYGCKLQLPYINDAAVIQFVRQNALTAPESQMTKNGGFCKELLTPALIVSDLQDREICPKNPKMIADIEESTDAPVTQGQSAESYSIEEDDQLFM